MTGGYIHDYKPDGRTVCGYPANKKRMGKRCGNCRAIKEGRRGGNIGKVIGPNAPLTRLGMKSKEVEQNG